MQADEGPGSQASGVSLAQHFSVPENDCIVLPQRGASQKKADNHPRLRQMTRLSGDPADGPGFTHCTRSPLYGSAPLLRLT